jgi:hypothetical protein
VKNLLNRPLLSNKSDSKNETNLRKGTLPTCLILTFFSRTLEQTEARKKLENQNLKKKNEDIKRRRIELEATQQEELKQKKEKIEEKINKMKEEERGKKLTSSNEIKKPAPTAVAPLKRPESANSSSVSTKITTATVTGNYL